ncbi:ABC transporter ATP-binding protein [Micromonospora eburnea]|uniref:ATP-binding cassette, subfamily C n=1 Tax=Micromonospora eburnea TaxID=227316 RepID=A0A1C6UWV7_9ACTN|nr:ABC transporter ATP-binding protein [Micromonospora eburnea]SCL58461.1 ATP-binding cassette, subfamily C [Micromonospora eburnea]
MSAFAASATPTARPGPALLVREILRHRRALVRIALWSLVEAVPALASGLVVAAAIDRYLAGDVATGSALLALLLVGTAIGVVGTRQLYPWLASVVEPVRDAFVTAVVTGTVRAAAGVGRPAGTAGVVRLTEQVEAVRTALFGLLRQVRRIAFTFVAVLVGLAVLAPVTAALTASLVVLAVGCFAFLLPNLAGRYRAVLAAEEEVAHRAGQVFDGLRDVIACGGERRAIAHLQEAVDRQVALERALARANAWRGLVVFLGGQLPLLVLLLTAPWLLRTGRLTLAETVGAATYLSVSLEPALRGLVGVVSSAGLTLVVNLRRLAESVPPPPEPGGGARRLTARYDLVVRDLTFAYGPHSAPVVRDLSLDLPEGSHLAVVGPSGIGKSTLAGLLAGLFPADLGTVTVGGVDVREACPSDLRRRIALVPQEAYVFAGTVRENLRYLAPEATDDELAAAAEAVGLAPVLRRLGGLDAQIGAGGPDLSTGERQLIALARVYLSPARIVILDEATANLDPATEARTEAAFAARPGTLIVVAHRISSARRADRVLVLDGDRHHLGTDPELTRTSPLYADLVGHWTTTDQPADGTRWETAAATSTSRRSGEPPPDRRRGRR